VAALRARAYGRLRATVLFGYCLLISSAQMVFCILEQGPWFMTLVEPLCPGRCG